VCGDFIVSVQKLKSTDPHNYPRSEGKYIKTCLW